MFALKDTLLGHQDESGSLLGSTYLVFKFGLGIVKLLIQSPKD